MHSSVHGWELQLGIISTIPLLRSSSWGTLTGVDDGKIPLFPVEYFLTPEGITRFELPEPPEAAEPPSQRGETIERQRGPEASGLKGLNFLDQEGQPRPDAPPRSVPQETAGMRRVRQLMEDSQNNNIRKRNARWTKSTT